jgi:hypothetical protein
VEDPRNRPLGWREATLAFLGSVAVAIGLTWPLASAPARLGTPNMDAYGNTWAICWVARQLFRDPAHLFDSNMFHPYTKSLAYAESLVPQALQAWPVLALGGPPLLAYNVVLLLNLAGSAFGAYVLARELGAAATGAALAAVTFGFTAFRWDHLVHLQTLSTPWLPLALVFARRSLRAGGAANAVGLGACAALQALSSGYYALLSALAIGCVLAFELRRKGAWRRLLGPGLALGCAMLPLLVMFGEYKTVRDRHGFSRGRAEAIGWSATPASYLDPGGDAALPHTRWLMRAFATGEPLFPGTAALLLAVASLGQLRRSANVQLVFLLGLLGGLLSLGPQVGIFGLSLPGPFELLRLLPGGGLLRTPARMGVLALLAVGVLAALEWTRLARRLGGRAGSALGALLLGWALLEAYSPNRRGGIREVPAAPPTVAWLASAPRGVVLELPWNAAGESALYLYWSTGHWQPMLNGFGSFDPPGQAGIGLLGNRWPTAYSAGEFRRLGVRYVVVHEEMLRPAHRTRLLATTELPAGVRLAFAAGPHRIYEIDPLPPG